MNEEVVEEAGGLEILLAWLVDLHELKSLRLEHEDVVFKAEQEFAVFHLEVLIETLKREALQREAESLRPVGLKCPICANDLVYEELGDGHEWWFCYPCRKIADIPENE